MAAPAIVVANALRRQFVAQKLAQHLGGYRPDKVGRQNLSTRRRALHGDDALLHVGVPADRSLDEDEGEDRDTP